jgi:hypothetical protein
VEILLTFVVDTNFYKSAITATASRLEDSLHNWLDRPGYIDDVAMVTVV